MQGKELIRTWRKAGFTLRLYDLNKISGGKSMLGYELKDGRTVVFAGDDFGCSPMHAIDSLETVMGLLGFLIVGDGDVDPTYFTDYTPEQIAWRDSSRRDELSMIVCETEDRLDARRRARNGR